jgi:hypothetical protein
MITHTYIDARQELISSQLELHPQPAGAPKRVVSMAFAYNVPPKDKMRAMDYNERKLKARLQKEPA